MSLRLKRRGGGAPVGAILGLAMLALFPAVAEAQSMSQGKASVVVQPGDSLWSITSARLVPNTTPQHIAIAPAASALAEFPSEIRADVASADARWLLSSELIVISLGTALGAAVLPALRAQSRWRPEGPWWEQAGGGNRWCHAAPLAGLENPTKPAPETPKTGREDHLDRVGLFAGIRGKRARTRQSQVSAERRRLPGQGAGVGRAQPGYSSPRATDANAAAKKPAPEVDMSLTDCQSGKMRVLLASELCYYHEVIAQTLRALRPEVELTTVAPADRDSSILRLAPDMVICSEATEVVRKNVPVWVELYPRREAYSVVSIEGKRKEYGLIQLSDLLFIVDQAKGLAR